MKILRNKEVLISKARFVSASKGLMFSKKLKSNEAVILDINNHSDAIHMWFVFFSINVAWLDENYKVVDYKKNIKPFTFYVKPKSRPKYIVEFTNDLDIKIGDKLSIIK